MGFKEIKNNIKNKFFNNKNRNGNQNTTTSQSSNAQQKPERITYEFDGLTYVFKINKDITSPYYFEVIYAGSDIQEIKTVDRDFENTFGNKRFLRYRNFNDLMLDNPFAKEFIKTERTKLGQKVSKKEILLETQYNNLTNETYRNTLQEKYTTEETIDVEYKGNNYQILDQKSKTLYFEDGTVFGHKNDMSDEAYAVYEDSLVQLSGPTGIIFKRTDTSSTIIENKKPLTESWTNEIGNQYLYRSIADYASTINSSVELENTL
ncbi:MAG: hypothetical protein IJW59_05555 [Clostridia bacterium]|nr:hypothetical protein [Clostridia bacterium]